MLEITVHRSTTMTSKRSTFRPSFQSLENRQCLAASALVAGELPARPDVETDEIAIIAANEVRAVAADHQYNTGGIFTITVTIIDDDTGGGDGQTGEDLLIVNNGDGSDVEADAGGGPHVKVFDGTTDEYAGNTIFVGEKRMRIARSEINATDAFFSELGSDSTRDAPSSASQPS